MQSVSGPAVRVSPPKGRGGAGYAITPCLVLTASYLVTGTGRTPVEGVRVRFLGSDELWESEVVWSSPKDRQPIALLRVTRGDEGVVAKEPVPLAKFTGIGLYECEATGFPLLLHSADQRVSALRLTGTVDSGMSPEARRF